MAKTKKSKKQKQTMSDGSCIGDSCLYFNVDGCIGFDGGCLDFDGGCLDFDGGCIDIGDGCAMVFLFPLRILVILGLMLYGDWDYRNWQSKIPD